MYRTRETKDNPKLDRLSLQLFGSPDAFEKLKEVTNLISRCRDSTKHDPFVDLSEFNSEAKLASPKQECQVKKRRDYRRKFRRRVTEGWGWSSKRKIRCLVCYKQVPRLPEGVPEDEDQNKNGVLKKDDTFLTFIQLIMPNAKVELEKVVDMWKTGDEEDCEMELEELKRGKLFPLERRNMRTFMCETCCKASQEIVSAYRAIKNLQELICEMRSKIISAIKLSDQVATEEISPQDNDKAMPLRKKVAIKSVDYVRKLVLKVEDDDDGSKSNLCKIENDPGLRKTIRYASKWVKHDAKELMGDLITTVENFEKRTKSSYHEEEAEFVREFQDLTVPPDIDTSSCSTERSRRGNGGLMQAPGHKNNDLLNQHWTVSNTEPLTEVHRHEVSDEDGLFKVHTTNDDFDEDGDDAVEGIQTDPMGDCSEIGDRCTSVCGNSHEQQGESNDEIRLTLDEKRKSMPTSTRKICRIRALKSPLPNHSDVHPEKQTRKDSRRHCLKKPKSTNVAVARTTVRDRKLREMYPTLTYKEIRQRRRELAKNPVRKLPDPDPTAVNLLTLDELRRKRGDLKRKLREWKAKGWLQTKYSTMTVKTKDGLKEIKYIDEEIPAISALYPPSRNRNNVIKRVMCEDGVERSFLRGVEIKKKDGFFMCSICDSNGSFPYSNFNSLRQHIKREHIEDVPKYTCEFCGKEFSYKNYLAKHIANIHEGKKFQCDLCGDLFSGSSQIRAHKKAVHEGIKPHLCYHCPKSFSTRKDRDLHVRRHTGEKPFVCHVCADAFVCNQTLKKHVLRKHPEAAGDIPPAANRGKGKLGNQRNKNEKDEGQNGVD